MKFKKESMYCQALRVVLLTLITIPFAAAQLPSSSAPERTQCKFQDHTDVTIEYGSMGMKGHKIFGDLVPYGKVWETGYKRTSTFVTNANLLVGGKDVAAGHYNLSTIPDRDKWTMIVTETPRKDSPTRAAEVARIDLTIRRLPAPLENFTISFDQMRAGCVLNLRWEETEASVLLAEKK